MIRIEQLGSVTTNSQGTNQVQNNSNDCFNTSIFGKPINDYIEEQRKLLKQQEEEDKKAEKEP